jgi:flagellar operon protein
MNAPIQVGKIYTGRMVPTVTQQHKSSSSKSSDQASFESLLQNSLVRFSNHAVKRLEQRGLDLKPDQLQKIENAINDVAAKGGKESLILLKDMALIVNVNNRTVVTAMDGSNMRDNVFTQIDSAVIIS